MIRATKAASIDRQNHNGAAWPAPRRSALICTAAAGTLLTLLSACASSQAGDAHAASAAPATADATLPRDAATPAPAALQPSAPGLADYKLVWSDEFNKASWTQHNPKGSAKWFSLPSVPGKYIGYQVHDDESMAIKNGILVNTLGFKSAQDVAGSRCAGPLGMKDDSGTALLSVDKLGAPKRGDKRLTWGGAGWVGMKFTTPAAGLSVSQLGLYTVAGNSEKHELRIFDAATGDDVAQTIVDLKGQPAGWVYAPIAGGAKHLEGSHTYCLMSWQYSQKDSWYDGQTTVTAADGITVSESEWGNWHAGSLFSIDRDQKGFRQQYGYWEARAKMPAGGVGLWPSFCLYTIGGKSPLGEEVDIFEEYGGAFEKNQDGGFGMRNHNWGKGPKEGAVDVWPKVSKPWQNWHVYGFLATPTTCAFYVDGVKRGEYPTPTSYQTVPMYMTLEYNIGGGWPLTGVIANSRLDVDWVRVWAPAAR